MDRSDRPRSAITRIAHRTMSDDIREFLLSQTPSEQRDGLDRVFIAVRRDQIAAVRQHDPRAYTSCGIILASGVGFSVDAPYSRVNRWFRDEE